LKNDGKEKTQEISHKILAYLIDNPMARDTLEGIVEWWMLQQNIKHNIAMVRKALDELVGRKLLVERKGNDARKYYQVNRNKHLEISLIINKRLKGRTAY
jgi:hypothetical protein